jgi:hypothetical protein
VPGGSGQEAHAACGHRGVASLLARPRGGDRAGAMAARVHTLAVGTTNASAWRRAGILAVASAMGARHAAGAARPAS